MSDAFAPAAFVHSVIDADGAVLLDLRQGKYYSLNELGVDIWRGIEARRTHDEILHSLHDRLAVPPEVLVRDVDAFLATLRRLQLVEGA
jgi:hypothetical protein